nr:enzymatic polyprotein [Tanacetum cinerariifolium]
MKREEDIEKLLQNSSHGKPKWYVIFNGRFRGIYTDWATASTHIIEKSVSHKSYLTKEAAEKSLEESYKTIATEETQKSKQFVSLNQHLQSQTAKLNAFNRMKNIPTAKEKEEMRRPIVENFQRLLDSLMNYNEVHATMLFYPKKRNILDPRRYPIFDKEQKLLVHSITVAQLGVSNKGYPDKDEKIECAPPTIDDWYTPSWKY